MWSDDIKYSLGKSTPGEEVLVPAKIRPFSGLNLSLHLVNIMKWKFQDAKRQRPVKEVLNFLYS